MKRCNKCGVEKDEGEFYASSGNTCKVCVCAAVRAYNHRPEKVALRKAYKQRPEVRASDRAREIDYSRRPEVKARKKVQRERPEAQARARAYAQRPEEKARKKAYKQTRAAKMKDLARQRRADVKEHAKAYYRRPDIKAHVSAQKREYNQRPDIKAQRARRHVWRYANDPEYYWMRRIRGIQRRAYIAADVTKDRHTIEILGCSAAQFREHIASLFTTGMSWDNYGEWEIDHKFPLSRVNRHDSEQVAKACHYTNLQPLWAADNRSKGAKTDWEKEAR